MDYQANSHKSKDPNPKPQPKNIEKVVTGEVVTRKKPLGRKFKDLFISADAKSVVVYVCTEVLLPAARNMIVDASTKGIERMMYGESRSPRRQYGNGPRVTYNSPVNRGTVVYSGPGASMNRGMVQTPKQTKDDVIFPTREEAERVLESMSDLLNTYEYVSVSDFNELVGLPNAHTDNKWGWLYLRGASIQQVREGYLLNLPPVEPL